MRIAVKLKGPPKPRRLGHQGHPPTRRYSASAIHVRPTPVRNPNGGTVVLSETLHDELSYSGLERVVRSFFSPQIGPGRKPDGETWDPRRRQQRWASGQADECAWWPGP